MMYDKIKGTTFEKFVANPDKGSMHNYGVAVDITIVDETDHELDMGFSPFRKGTFLIYWLYAKKKLGFKLTDNQRKNRELLADTMVRAGFTPLSFEWWHFNGIPKNDALILTKNKNISDFFSACAPLCQDRKKLSHWIIKELFRLLKDSSIKIDQCQITPDSFSLLINLISKDDITESIGRTVLEEMFNTGKGPVDIIDKKGLKPIADNETLEVILNEVISENPQVIDKINAGETKPIDFLIGQVMKKTKGKANAKKVKSMINKKLLQ